MTTPLLFRLATTNCYATAIAVTNVSSPFFVSPMKHCSSVHKYRKSFQQDEKSWLCRIRVNQYSASEGATGHAWVIVRPWESDKYLLSQSFQGEFMFRSQCISARTVKQIFLALAGLQKSLQTKSRGDWRTHRTVLLRLLELPIWDDLPRVNPAVRSKVKVILKFEIDRVSLNKEWTQVFYSPHTWHRGYLNGNTLRNLLIVSLCLFWIWFVTSSILPRFHLSILS